MSASIVWIKRQKAAIARNEGADAARLRSLATRNDESKDYATQQETQPKRQDEPQAKSNGPPTVFHGICAPHTRRNR